LGWEERAGKKFKINVYGRTEETGGFSSINAYKMNALKTEEVQQQEAMLMEEKAEEEKKWQWQEQQGLCSLIKVTFLLFYFTIQFNLLQGVSKK
jgi:hypothetical protein